ncbi:MAG: SDR family oxidoreductase [Candidatus Promineifilaceae bacterium]|nr:SDR family oxidoreductase [Candidatus Promineifilaceae bacterium]
MKVTVFGATGRTGQHVVEQALERGHEVKAFARSPQKLDAFGDRITVVEGDVQDDDAVQEAVAGADAVVSVLGPTENVPDYQVTRGTRHILDAMKQHDVDRLVVSAGAGVGDPKDEPRLFNKLINVLLKLFSRHVYEDMKRTVAAVRDSDVDWTIVRVPMLTDDGPKGEVKVGYVGKGMGPRITRADMASFMLDQLDSDAYLHKAPAISN